MLTTKSIIASAYLQACKERDKRTMQLFHLRNQVGRGIHSKMHRQIVTNHRDTAGWQAWAQYIRSLNVTKARLKHEHVQYKNAAKALNTVLRYLKKQGN
jgi:hypothetical protein